MDSENIPAVLHDSNCIAGVMYHVKSGKEADVYCCEAHPYLGAKLLAAKVYRPLEARGFRNDSVYQQGRFIKDSRLHRAYQNKSRAGRHTQFDLWVSAEYETLRILHAAGARVPKPYESLGSAIVMEYIGSADRPALSLDRVKLTKDEALRIRDDLLHQVQLWLSCGRIHADLSPYNMLYMDGAITVIDFPQSVNPDENNASFGLLLRDLEHVAKFFGKLDHPFDPFETARLIWNACSLYKVQ